jgi:hypothetical protein
VRVCLLRVRAKEWGKRAVCECAGEGVVEVPLKPAPSASAPSPL